MEATTTDPTIDAVSSGIVGALATHAGTDPLDMDPLYNTIDLEALEALLADGSDVRVTFEYEGYTVAVEDDSTVTIDGQAYDATDVGEFSS